MGRVWRGLGAAGPLSEVIELFLFAFNVTCDFFLHGPRVGWLVCPLFVIVRLGLRTVSWSVFGNVFSICFSWFVCVCLSFVYFTCVRRCLSVYLFCLPSIGWTLCQVLCFRFCPFFNTWEYIYPYLFVFDRISVLCLSVCSNFLYPWLSQRVSICLSVGHSRPSSPPFKYK